MRPADPAFPWFNLVRRFGGWVGRNQPFLSLERPHSPMRPRRPGRFVQLDRSTQQIIIDNALIWISGPERLN
jgi:hypothetical protein